MKVIKYGDKVGQEIAQVISMNSRGTLYKVKMVTEEVIHIPVNNILEIEEENAIESFLNAWEAKAVEFYLNKKRQFESLSRKEITKFQRDETKEVYSMIFEHDDEIREIVKKERVRKESHLISRIEQKAGKILDAKKLSLGVNGEINGEIVGESKTVKVQTIYAGGENIQVLHYRVLVKEVK